MTSEILLYKDKFISGNNVEIIFHKEYQWTFNDTELPIVKYQLTNCKDLAQLNFADIDYYNDGVVIEVTKTDNLDLFETEDMTGTKFRIVCEKAERIEAEYRKEDYCDIINSLKEENESLLKLTSKLNTRIDKAVNFINHELEASKRKLKDASWLPNDRKIYLTQKIEALKSLTTILEKNDAS